jgi:hypothetical protein
VCKPRFVSRYHTGRFQIDSQVHFLALLNLDLGSFNRLRSQFHDIQGQVVTVFLVIVGHGHGLQVAGSDKREQDKNHQL